ncbi:Chloramphenicol acetyltransferase-like domain protein [Akanthomyces lecanii RCEF 1005]|uniref:Chloramphenicol acetyltransferase-like domain protein n=1 Tax=Akanthomyces lecanii RCEF 1005 TaxID=1081108 RepID=A0A168F779_CORDF|nr:Chloramphenicol acetyltransferase-like domain protein [Akanthomyces lecanii RCEF 1005]
MSSLSLPGEEKAMDHQVFTTNFFENDAEFQKMIMRTTVRFNDRLDPEMLRSSLSELVQLPTWRKFAGRFSINSEGRVQIITPHTLPDDYVLVDYRHVDCAHRNIGDHEAVAKLPENLKASSVHHTWGQESSLFRPDDFTATSTHSYIADSRPPLLLYVTTFRDGTMMSLIWPHVLFDGAGLAAFLGAWSLVVNGKISQVPPILPDPMPNIMDEATMAKEQGQLPKFPVHKLLLIVVWMLWRTWTKPRNERRFVVLTKESVARLRHRAALGAPADKECKISDGVLITAWIAKTLAAADKDYTTSNIVCAVNVRRSLPELQVLTGEYIQNLVASFFITLPQTIVQAPLLQLASFLRGEIRERTSAASVRAYFRDRHEASLASSKTNIYDPRTAAHTVVLPVFVNNMASLCIAEQLDFGSAVVGTAQGKRTNRIGTPLYFRNSNAVWTEQKLNMASFAVQGRSEEGSYYLDACLPPRAYVLMEESLRVGEAL